jgi:hypothetical protein
MNLVLKNNQYEECLTTDATLVPRLLIALEERQTRKERELNTTQNSNRRGFNCPDARALSPLAKKVLAGNYLTESERQLSVKKLPKYFRQLAHLMKGCGDPAIRLVEPRKPSVLAEMPKRQEPGVYKKKAA